MSYLQAIIIALVQGVTELFPVSSLGHSVLVPAWIGGSWQTLVEQSSSSDSSKSFYLAFIVALHVATALALLWFFRADWMRLIAGFFRSLGRTLRERRFSAADADERLAWLIVIATIPVGLVGLGLEHVFRTVFAKPLAAAVLLTINGLFLLAGERARRRADARGSSGGFAATPEPVVPAGAPVADSVADSVADAGATDPVSAPGPRHSARSAADLAEAEASDHRIAALSYGDGLVVGAFQILALLAGISRSGITMVGGLWRGLDNEDAARFAFLLATPVILAAGVLKLPSLAGPAGAHIHGQVIVGFVVAGIAAYLSVRFLTRYFRTNTLIPFAGYCLVVGVASIVRFAVF